MRRPPPPDVLSYEDLRAKADDFLDTWSPDTNCPVDVEHIADVQLGIDIVPVEGLQDDLEIDGLFSRAANTIAHELGHWYLHEEIHKATSFSSVDEWKEFYSAITERNRFFYEYQAYSFGGLILVQEEPLEARIDEAVRHGRSVGMDISLKDESHCEYVAERVGQYFDVSKDVVLKRGYYDDHWRYR